MNVTDISSGVVPTSSAMVKAPLRKYYNSPKALSNVGFLSIMKSPITTVLPPPKGRSASAVF